MRAQKVEGALHGPRAEQHLGDEAVAGSHALADHLHAGEQGVVEDLAARDARREERLGEGVHGGGVAVDQGLFELVFHWMAPPLQAQPPSRTAAPIIDGPVGEGDAVVRDRQWPGVVRSLNRSTQFIGTSSTRAMLNLASICWPATAG